MADTNVFSILSLIFAFIFFPLGILFGIIALVQIKESGDKGKGLAIAGIVISALVPIIYFMLIGFMAYFGVLGPR